MSTPKRSSAESVSRQSLLSPLSPLSHSTNYTMDKTALTSTPRKKGYSSYTSRSKDLDTSLEWRDATQKASTKSGNLSFDDKMLASKNGESSFSKYEVNANMTDVEKIAPSRKAKILEFENNTISKQRSELQLLIAELKDRDRELNEMVTAHQRQIAAWDADRQKMLILEERSVQFEKELELKNDELRGLLAKLRTVQSEEHNTSTALDSTKKQLQYVTEQHSSGANKLLVTQEKNDKLKAIVKEQDDHITQMEAREQELLELLKLKDRDLSDASTTIAEMTGKVQRLEQQGDEGKRTEAELRRQVAEWKNKQKQIWKEYEHVKRELVKSEQGSDDLRVETQRNKQEIATFKKELMLAGEREKRKNQLLELQKSKQERADAELSHVRGLYERQQKDLSLLHLNLESTKDLLALQQKHMQPNTSRYLSSITAAEKPSSPSYSPNTSIDKPPISTYSSKERRPTSPYSSTDKPYSSKDRSAITSTERPPLPTSDYSNAASSLLSPYTEHRSAYSSSSLRAAEKPTDDYESRLSYPVLPEPGERSRNSSVTTEDSYMAQQYDYRGREKYSASQPMEESFVSDIVDDEPYVGSNWLVDKVERDFSSDAGAETASYKRSTEAGLSHQDAAEIDRILAKHLGSRYTPQTSGNVAANSEDKDEKPEKEVLDSDSRKEDVMDSVKASEKDADFRGDEVKYTESLDAHFQSNDVKELLRNDMENEEKRENGKQNGEITEEKKEGEEEQREQKEDSEGSKLQSVSSISGSDVQNNMSESEASQHSVKSQSSHSISQHNGSQENIEDGQEERKDGEADVQEEKGEDGKILGEEIEKKNDVENQEQLLVEQEEKKDEEKEDSEIHTVEENQQDQSQNTNNDSVSSLGLEEHRPRSSTPITAKTNQEPTLLTNGSESASSESGQPSVTSGTDDIDRVD